MDGFLPHLPTRFILRSQQSRSPLSILLNTFHRIPMAYSSNSSFYPSSSTPSEFNMYPPPRRTSAVEEANVRASNTFTHGWSVDGQPDRVVDSPRRLRSEASFGEYDCSFLDGLPHTKVLRIGVVGHLVRGSGPGLWGNIVSQALLANNWPVRPVVPLRYRRGTRPQEW